MSQHKWDRIAEDVSFNLEIDIKRFRNNVPLESRILDFGCGYGRVGKILWDSGYKNTIGVDPSEKMIERGKRDFPELQLEVFSGKDLPYPDNSFDAIVTCAVFTCITSKKIRNYQFKELCRTLRPEGLLHMVEFCSEPSQSFTASIGIPMLHSTPQELRDLAGRLKVVYEEVVNTKTMGGNRANSYSLLARKPLST